MNTDDFEQHLRRQPLRPVPPDWREEILRVARANAPVADGDGEAVEPPGPTASRVATSRPPGHSLVFALGCRLRDWLWPNPVAWGALAVCWVAIVTLNVAALPSSAERAEARVSGRIAAAYYSIVQSPGYAGLASESYSRQPADRPRPARRDQSDQSVSTCSRLV